jgi:hypothetical protein
MSHDWSDRDEIRQALVDTLAAAGGPVYSEDLTGAVLADPRRPFFATYRALIDLLRDGTLVVVKPADGFHGDLMELAP